MLTTNLAARIQRIRLAVKDVRFLKTAYYNCKCRRYSFPLIIYPNVHVRIGAQARIVHSRGRLEIGKRWSIGRYYPSEFIIADGGSLEINGDFKIYTGCSIIVDPGARLSIGNGAINLRSRIAAFCSIVIGDNVYISENVTIRDSDNHAISGNTAKYTAPIMIGNNVLIGINATILKGVTIGDGAVVAANALVNRPVPPRALVGGVPARILQEGVTWTF